MREFQLTDAEALHRVIGDADVMASQKRTMSETREWIRYHLTGYASCGFSLWALIAKDSGELIGDCGHFSRTVAGSPEFELGYHLRRDQWGRGIATEAALAVRNYARDRLHVRRLVAMTQPGNVRSRRVMEKVGMKMERTFDKTHPDLGDEPRVLYSMRL